jgi:hypothetical protein
VKFLKKTIVSLLLLTILSLMVISISQVEATSNFNILSDQGFVAITGAYYIVGEVQNVGSQPQKYVEIIATFYSSNGTMVGTDYTYADLDVINPGCKSPFWLIFTETTQIPQIDHYTLTVSSSVATSLPENLNILSSSSYVSISGNLHVIGEIQNLGSGNATFVRLIATFYDQTGKVVGSDYTYSNPYDLASGQKAPFDLIYIYTARVPLIKSYVLTADSLEYSLLSGPEPNTTLASFCALFGTKSFQVIYPSDLATPKPLGCSAAWVSDWLSSMAVSTKLSYFTEGLDTEAAFVNQISGKPLGSSQTGIVSFGGPFVNPVVKYAESDSTPLGDQAPIRFQNDVTTFRFMQSNGTAIAGASLPVSVINQDEDMFVIEVYRDGDGRNIMLCYGFGWKGTYAAGKYFDQIIYHNLYAYDVSWVIVKWEDTNNNSFVNNPGDGDSYTLIAAGS